MIHCHYTGHYATPPRRYNRRVHGGGCCAIMIGLILGCFIAAAVAALAMRAFLM